MNPAQKHNFGASSRILPDYVLNRAADAVKKWGANGLSILKVSHSSPAFEDGRAATEYPLGHRIYPSGYDGGAINCIII